MMFSNQGNGKIDHYIETLVDCLALDLKDGDRRLLADEIHVDLLRYIARGWRSRQHQLNDDILTHKAIAALLRKKKKDQTANHEDRKALRVLIKNEKLTINALQEKLSVSYQNALTTFNLFAERIRLLQSGDSQQYKHRLSSINKKIHKIEKAIDKLPPHDSSRSGKQEIKLIR